METALAGPEEQGHRTAGGIGDDDIFRAIEIDVGNDHRDGAIAGGKACCGGELARAIAGEYGDGIVAGVGDHEIDCAIEVHIVGGNRGRRDFPAG